MVSIVGPDPARWTGRLNPGRLVDPGVRRYGVLRAFVALASALVAGMMLVPAGAVAHAELDTVTPADGSTVLGSPTGIVMTFTQHLDPARSNIRLVNAGGSVIVEGSIVDADRTTMRMAITSPLATGVYAIRWTSFSSEDSEQDHGTTTFTVAAAPSAATSVAPSVAAPGASAGGPSLGPSGVPSAMPAPPGASTGDAVFPVVVALVVLAGLGVWLLRGRARAR